MLKYFKEEASPHSWYRGQSSISMWGKEGEEEAKFETSPSLQLFVLGGYLCMRWHKV